MPTVEEQARLILESALDHKRATIYHRKMMRARMQELQRFCETAGIKFTTTTKDIGEIHSHDPQESAPRTHHDD